MTSGNKDDEWLWTDGQTDTQTWMIPISPSGEKCHDIGDQKVPTVTLIL